MVRKSERVNPQLRFNVQNLKWLTSEKQSIRASFEKGLLRFNNPFIAFNSNYDCNVLICEARFSGILIFLMRRSF